MPTPPSINYDHTGRLATDLPCANCGHNLRGLLPTGKCGECGTPVKWTLRGNPLGTVDPDWLRRVRSGVVLIVVLMVWVWVPYVWPVYAFGLWRLTAPEQPESSFLHGLRILYTWGLGLMIGLLLLSLEGGPGGLMQPVADGLSDDAILSLAAVGYGLVQCVIGVRLWHIGRRGKSRSLPSLAWLVALAGMIAAAAAAMTTLHELDLLDVQKTDMLVLGVALGLAGLFPALVLLCVALLVGARVLRVAEVQARALRDEVKAWQGPTPGESWRRQAAASAPAASGSPGPAGA